MTSQLNSMSLKIQRLREKAATGKWEKAKTEAELKGTTSKLRRINRESTFSRQAQQIIRKAAIDTQEQIRFHLSALVTSAIKGIVPPRYWYDFSVSFLEQRGGVECEFSLRRGEGKERGVFDVGGGISDIISCALQISVLMLTNNRRALIIDEPFRNLYRPWHKAAALFLKKVCEETGLQIIAVTHNEEIIDVAHSVFKVTSDGIKSTVEQSS